MDDNYSEMKKLRWMITWNDECHILVSDVTIKDLLEKIIRNTFFDISTVSQVELSIVEPETKE